MTYIDVNGVRIDRIVAEQLPDIKKGVMEKDRDKHFLIDGRERSGKSILAMQLAKALDADFNIDKIAFNGQDFIKLVKSPDRKKGDCILLDEAFGAANSQAFFTEISRAMTQVATEMGQLNLYVIIVLPSFFDLKRYFAIWRCDTLFHVYFNKRGDRGQYVIFPFEDKLHLYIYGKKTYDYGCRNSPYPPCKFPGDWVVDEEEYRKRKAGAFKKKKIGAYELRWKERTIGLMRYLYEKKLNHEQIGKIIGMEASNVANCLEKWSLEPPKPRNIVLNSLSDEDDDGEEEEEDE